MSRTFARLPQPVVRPPPPPPFRSKISPVHLVASALVASNSGGSVNATSLMNPMGLPMEILEVKFLLVSTSGTPISGSQISVKFDLGDIPLTNGLVPIWNLGTGEDIWDEQIASNNNFASKATNQRISYRWRLQHPLYVPANMVLMPTFQSRSQLASPLTVYIAYSGRVLLDNPPPPKKRMVPFASAYSSKAYSLTDAGAEASSEQELFNPFPEPVRLQRLTLRVSELIQGSFNGFDDHSSPVFPYELFTMQIVDSRGDPIVRDSTVPYQLIDPQTRSWELDGAMDFGPGAFWKVFLAKTAVAFSPATEGFTGSIFGQVNMALIGSREIAS